MNALFETLDEMTSALRIAESFQSANSHFDPRQMLIAVGFHLNLKGMHRFNEIESIKTLSGEYGDDHFNIIDLEKDYFTVPDYVIENEKQYQALLLKWSVSRSEDDLKEFLEFNESNYKHSKHGWRCKVIGSRTDLAVFEKDTVEGKDSGRYHVLAIASESLPYQWLEAFLRDVGDGNSVAWYGYNQYSSEHGTMSISENMIMVQYSNPVSPVIRSVMNINRPSDDDLLSVSDRYAMVNSLDSLIALISKRPALSSVSLGDRPVDIWIKAVGELNSVTGEDYWQLAELLDRILNGLNSQEQLTRLEVARIAFTQNVEHLNKQTYVDAYQDTLRDRGALLKERGEEFTIDSKDYCMWRFYVMNGATGPRALDNILEKRDEEIEFSKLLGGKLTIDEVKEMTEQALDKVLTEKEPVQQLSEHGQSVKAYQENQEAKAKWSDQEELDNIIQCERLMAQTYIEEAKDVALNTSTTISDSEKVLNFLIKVYQEKGLAQRIHSDLVASETTDEELKELYFEILDLCLSKRLQYQFTQAEIGSFYNWLNDKRQELKKDK